MKPLSTGRIIRQLMPKHYLIPVERNPILFHSTWLRQNYSGMTRQLQVQHLKRHTGLILYSGGPDIKLTQFYISEKQPVKALDVAGKNFKAHPSSFIVGLQYAQMLRVNGKYEGR